MITVHVWLSYVNYTGQYHDALSKTVTKGKEEVLEATREFLSDEITLYEFDGKCYMMMYRLTIYNTKCGFYYEAVYN